MVTMIFLKIFSYLCVKMVLAICKYRHTPLPKQTSKIGNVLGLTFVCYTHECWGIGEDSPNGAGRTLCQAVTAAADGSASQQMLEALERANLFVVPLDEQRQWYRFHDLFREALLARLHASQPQLVPLLHIRAASF
jgi:hypothetical protein